MSQDAFESGMDILNKRIRWEQKIRAYYEMRHDGLPRFNKPFPSAANGHYPLIDMTVRKLKPFWMGQVTSGEKLCSFTSMTSQPSVFADSMADYFDFQLRQKTTFLRKLRTAVDHMLIKGRGVLKATVDPLEKYRIVIDAVDPFFILMPQEADNFEDADEFVHVRQFTVDSYKRLDSRWDTSDKTVQIIRGKPPSNLNVIIDQKRLREGVNYTSNTELVLVWEHWRKTSAGHTIEYYSPLAPTEALRETHMNPYTFQGKESNVFYSFQMEVKDEGWYAPRGVAELLAPVEQYMTKLWNEKADALTFVNRPLLTGEKEIVNSANYRWAPGEYVPGNIQGVRMSPPPMSFDGELGFAQSIAEQQSQSPDFGITQPGEPSDTGGKPRTATENQRISALQQSGTNDNGLIFREDLTKFYRHILGLIVQFKERDFSYFAAGQVQRLPEQAVHDSYLMDPDGSPDGWNPTARFQKAMVGLQSFGGNPNVNMEVITKNALTAYNPRLSFQAFVPTNEKGATEYEDQAVLIGACLTANPPFPVTAKPSDDHLSRIKANIDWIHAAGALQVPHDPNAAQRIQQNTAQHIVYLQKQNPAAAKQVTELIKQMEMAGGQQNGQPPQGMAGNGSAAPSQPTQPGRANGSAKPLSESLSINFKDLQPDVQAQVLKQIGLQPSMMPPEAAPSHPANRPAPTNLPPRK